MCGAVATRHHKEEEDRRARHDEAPETNVPFESDVPLLWQTS